MSDIFAFDALKIIDGLYDPNILGPMMAQFKTSIMRLMFQKLITQLLLYVNLIINA